jgi:hypothetical protein
MKNDYGNFVMTYRRFTHTARSYDEAYNTADHATPIWRCETKNEKWLRDNTSWMIVIGALVTFAFILYPTLIWIIEQ